MVKFYMLIGLPGSGKSEIARQLADGNTIVLSSDAIRKEFYGDETIQDDPSWEYEALKEAADEHNYDEELEPQYLTGEYDYMSRFTVDFNHLLNHPNTDILLKSFVLYQEGYEDTEHTYLTLRAVCILEH